MKFYCILSLVTLGVFANGCGSESNDGSSEQKAPEKAEEPAPAEAPAREAGESTIRFKGFLGGAFPIVVDGVGYEDSEDFYTEELARLPEKISAAGYDSSWSWKFEAVLGFSDLRTNMMVYVAPQEKKGFQGEAPVSYAGGFEIALPKEALDASYMVRAVKRVNVVLQRQSEIVKICYNFSATDKGVLLEEASKPIILDQFSTRITAYSCAQDAINGLAIPQAQSSSSPDETSPIPEVPETTQDSGTYDGQL